jgi:hypothetical protein
MVYQKGISVPKKAMKLRRVPIAAKSTFAQMGYLDSTSLAGKLFFRNHLHDRAESLVERRNPYSVCFGYYFAGDKSLAILGPGSRVRSLRSLWCDRTRSAKHS